MNYVKPSEIQLEGHPLLNEARLQDHIAEDTELLGLAGLRVVARERRHEKAGRLDLLLASDDEDQKYEVELMLGDCEKFADGRTLRAVAPSTHPELERSERRQTYGRFYRVKADFMSERMRQSRPTEEAFDENAVEKILKRATQLERQERPGSTKLTVAEIEQIARDAGIDPASVQRAINDISHNDGAFSSKLFGAPVRYQLERELPFSLEVTDHEALVALIRDELRSVISMPPQISALGRSLTVAITESTRTIEIHLAPAGDKTKLRVTQTSTGLVRSVFGSAGAIAGGGVPTIGVFLGLQLASATGSPPALGIAAVVAAYLGTVFGTARSVFSRLTPRHNEPIDRLMSRLENFKRG